MINKTGGCWPLIELEMKISEADIQAEFYHCCRVLSLACTLEFSTQMGRHDVFILNSDCSLVLAIVECKRPAYKGNGESWQFKRYRLLGVPVYLLHNIDLCESLAIKIKSEHQTGPLLLEVLQIKPLDKPKRQSRIQRIINHLPSEVNYKP